MYEQHIISFFFLMLRRPPRSTLTDTLFPYTTLFRSHQAKIRIIDHGRGSSNSSLIIFQRYIYFTQQGIGSSAGRSSSRRSEEHTSELQSLMRISYAVFCLKKKKKQITDYCSFIIE